MLSPQPKGIPAPTPTPLSTPYWEACSRHQLTFLQCDDCSTIASLPALVCGECFGRSLSWRQSTGRGTLYSWTVVWRPQHPLFHVPYAPAIVAVEEGWYHIAAIIGCEPEQLIAGMALTVEFHPADDAITLPYYRPV